AFCPRGKSCTIWCEAQCCDGYADYVAYGLRFGVFSGRRRSRWHGHLAALWYYKPVVGGVDDVNPGDHFVAHQAASVAGHYPVGFRVLRFDVRCDYPADCASGSSKSPRSSSRSRTSSKRNCSTSSGLSNSSQVRGVATVGVNVPRSEYGAMVVLAAEFCDQSIKTLFFRNDFFMAETISSG